MSAAVSFLNSGNIPQGAPSSGNLRQSDDNGSSGGNSLTAFIQRSDSLEISSEARASFAAMMDGESGAMATVQDFSANFSASFQSQTLSHIEQIGGGRRMSTSAFSQTQFNFNVSISASSASLQTGDFDLDKVLDGKMKDYLILMKNFLKEMRHELHKFMKGLDGIGGNDGVIDVEDINGFVMDLSGKLEKFLNESAAFEGNRESIAAAMQHLDISIEVSTQQVSFFQQTSDPLALDLDGDGVQLTTPWEGMNFDIDADGVKDRVASLIGKDAFLALDRNGNGRIDNGKELFGDQHGSKHGFEEIEKYDTNRDGVIDARDAVYKNLLLYNDRNSDGITQRGETQSLLQAGIKSISLSYLNVEQYSAGNRISQVSGFTRNDGSEGQIADVWLNYLSGRA